MRKSKSVMPDQNAFKDAVLAIRDVKHCYKAGLTALGKHSSKVHLTNTRACNGSINIDACVGSIYPNENRWDYAFSYRSAVYFVEVHPAQTNEVDAVLLKLAWLKRWLESDVPDIATLKTERPYYWLCSGSFNILKTAPQYRRAVQAGILPISTLKI